MYLGFIVILALPGRAARRLRLPAARRCRPRTSRGTAATRRRAIVVWYFIALSALVDPGFWQRAYAARDPARRASARVLMVDRVLDRVRLHDHDDRALRARAAAEPRRTRCSRSPSWRGSTLPPFSARALLPRDDRDGDEHDRLVRLHRRDDDRARRDLAAAARDQRGARARSTRASVSASRPCSRRALAHREAERHRPVARPGLDHDSGAAAAGRRRAARARPARPALDARRDDRCRSRCRSACACWSRRSRRRRSRTRAPLGRIEPIYVRPRRVAR